MWRVEWEDAARKELRRLGNSEQQRVIRYLRERIATTDDPRRFGKALTKWAYGVTVWATTESFAASRMTG